MATVGCDIDRLFLQSSKDPIFVVVKEICWSPITTSSSYREREREGRWEEEGGREGERGGGRERRREKGRCMVGGGGRDREREGERRREKGGGRRMERGGGREKREIRGRKRGEEEGEGFLSDFTCYQVNILFTLHGHAQESIYYFTTNDMYS